MYDDSSEKQVIQEDLPWKGKNDKKGKQKK